MAGIQNPALGKHYFEEDDAEIPHSNHPKKRARTESSQESGHQDECEIPGDQCNSQTTATFKEPPTKHPQRTDHEGESSDSDSESDSNSNSDISETESEIAALDAELKRKYITFKRDGFGPIRGSDGKFPNFPPRLNLVNTYIEPAKCDLLMPNTPCNSPPLASKVVYNPSPSVGDAKGEGVGMGS